MPEKRMATIFSNEAFFMRTSSINTRMKFRLLNFMPVIFSNNTFCDAGFVFFGINAMKEQRNFRSIKYSCTLSEKVHQNFH